jgi:predicted RNA binding protein YcfA (HicA-like mRNA interferase family)
MRLTPISRRDFIKRLRNLGWEGPFAGGKHEFMVKGATKLPIPNPHGSSEISVGKLREILNEIGVSRDEWHRAS